MTNEHKSVERIYREFYKPFYNGVHLHVHNEDQANKIVNHAFDILADRIDEFDSEDEMINFVHQLLIVVCNRIGVDPGSVEDHFYHALIMFELNKLEEEERREKFRLFLKSIPASVAAFWSGTIIKIIDMINRLFGKKD